MNTLTQQQQAAIDHLNEWRVGALFMELGMDADEVLRLKQITGLAEAFKDEEFSKSWEPVYVDEPINEET